MKPFLLLLLSALSTISALSADLTLTDGRVFKDATVTAETPRSVTIKHAAGLSSVAKTLLPPELQAKYPINEAAALQADQRADATREKSRALQQAEAERVARLKEERAKSAAIRDANLATETNRKTSEAAAAKNNAKFLAERYFSQKHEWSPGNTTTCEVTIYDARPAEGWVGRWLVTGRAIIKRYDNNQTSTSTPNKNVGGVAETSIDSDTPKPRRHPSYSDGNYTLQTQDFEGVYSTEGTEPSLDVTLR